MLRLGNHLCPGAGHEVQNIFGHTLCTGQVANGLCNALGIRPDLHRLLKRSFFQQTQRRSHQALRGISGLGEAALQGHCSRPATFWRPLFAHKLQRQSEYLGVNLLHALQLGRHHFSHPDKVGKAQG